MAPRPSHVAASHASQPIQGTANNRYVSRRERSGAPRNSIAVRDSKRSARSSKRSSLFRLRSRFISKRSRIFGMRSRINRRYSVSLNPGALPPPGPRLFSSYGAIAPVCSIHGWSSMTADVPAIPPAAPVTQALVSASSMSPGQNGSQTGTTPPVARRAATSPGALSANHSTAASRSCSPPTTPGWVGCLGCNAIMTAPAPINPSPGRFSPPIGRRSGRRSARPPVRPPADRPTRTGDRPVPGRWT